MNQSNNKIKHIKTIKIKNGKNKNKLFEKPLNKDSKIISEEFIILKIC